MEHAVALCLFVAVVYCSVEENTRIADNIGLLEGDMKLLPYQRRVVIGGLNSQKGPMKSRIWPGGVLIYDIERSLTGQAKAMSAIRTAFQEYEKKTCIRFTQRTNEVGYVSLFRGRGCWSFVGWTGRKQRLSISQKCWRHGTVIHELAHALGLFHEQSRPDRDNYVVINRENIRDDAKNNFNKYFTVSSLLTKYDYNSVMHYGPYFFSKNGKPTILATKSGVVIGQRTGLSPTDAIKINLLYKFQCKAGPAALPLTPKLVGANGPACTFDVGFCGWTQSSKDKFRWYQARGKTPSRDTGPDSDVSGTGNYIYIEASKGNDNDRAKLLFRGLGSGSVCFRFFYHMYGVNVKTLNLYNGGRVAWTLSGNQGNKWAQAEVDLSGNYDLVLEGVRGSSYKGDIAVDDITVTPGACRKPPTPPECQVSTVRPASPSGRPTTKPLTTPAPGLCGLSPVKRVIGGEDSKPGNWPWQVGLHRYGRFICGGSLIRPTWVVTAAHCVTNKIARNYFVRLGDNDRSKSEGSEQDIKVKRIVSHPDYGKPRLNNDIALLELVRSANLNRRVGLVCLPPQDYNVSLNANCFITGWGKIKHPGNAHNILQQANMGPISQAECRVKNDKTGVQITPQMLCAGKPGSILSGCHGDSGGPYVCQNDVGLWVLQGAVSWGSSRCDALSAYSVFARVAKFRDWIDKHTAPLKTTSNPVTPPTPSVTQTKRTTTMITLPPPVKTTGRQTIQSSTSPPLPSPSGICGLSPVSRVIGGEDSKPGNWPWQVGVHRFGRFICGGSLINPTWVVTAAHCVTNKRARDYFVRLGDNDRSKFEGSEQDIKVARVVSHPDYGRPRLNNDIALLELVRPAILNSRVGLVCLPPQDFNVSLDANCYITGWGKIKHPGKAHNILQQANMGPISQAECKIKNDKTGVQITPQMMCAGKPGSILSGCHGDSGGPYVCQNDVGLWVLQGAVSWGSSRCDAKSVYSVFARVAKFRDWIDNCIGSSNTPPAPSFPSTQPPTTTSVTTLPPTTSPASSTTESPSPPPPEICGLSSMSRVIGGQNAKPGNWPWQIGLHRYGRFICGGSLIRLTWVLTAAHCVTNKKASDYFVRLGDNDRSKSEGSEQDIKIKRIVSHPNYGKPRLNNDIALLELVRPAILNSRVGLVCLPPQDYILSLNSNCYITGWGKIKHPGNAHNILQQANMGPINQAECKIKNDKTGVQITPQMLCAGKPGSILGGCHGDSGGPYVCQNDVGLWVLQGAVSWGSSRCDAKSVYSVFARVAKFRDWIDKYIGLPPTPSPPSTPVIPPIPPILPTTPALCGIRPLLSRIVGGTEAAKNSWPWQVMLRRNTGAQFCGGSLIHPLWVVTASHCVEHESTSSFSVRLGAHFLFHGSTGREQDVKISRIIIHPSYNPVTLVHDIALLQLAEPAKLGKGIGLVCLGDDTHRLPINDTKRCYITGWGTLTSGGKQPNVLMQASVPLVAKKQCLQGYPNKIDDSMLCAGLDKGGVDACQGDSGGPLVCEYGHRWYLEGVTSWGYGCAQALRYGVYAKVRYFKKWLADNVRVTTPTTGVSSAFPQTSPKPQTTIPTTAQSTNPPTPSPECANYNYLTDADRAMTHSSKLTPKCDRDMSGWYRFHGAAGDHMATSCVKMRHCGTHAPGWLETPHPAPNQGVRSVKVCFHWVSNCCQWSTNIMVRNCGAFFVYQLKDVPACYLRYCGNGFYVPPTSASSTTSPKPPTTVALTTLPSASPTPIAVCTFNEGLCPDWSQSKVDQFDWINQAGRTPSSGTGPSYGHGGSGKYMYIETSYPRRRGDKAVLKLALHGKRGSSCLSFYYHMYGSSVGTLNVYNGNAKVFTKSSGQGNIWKKARVQINLDGTEVKFEGIAGASWTGDIAIDDVSIMPGSCRLRQKYGYFGLEAPRPLCGISYALRADVVNAAVHAGPGRWPWQISLLRGKSKSFICGGSLISSFWVLTAAHCISLPAHFYTVRLGDYNRLVDEGTEEDITAMRVIVHPNYNKPHLNNDIALIQLTRPATLGARVGTVCLPSQDEVFPTSSKCFVTGWGNTKHPGFSSQLLQETQMTPVSNEKCALDIQSNPEESQLVITPEMFCAEGTGSSAGAFENDMGAPYVCQRVSGDWVLHGALSWVPPRFSKTEKYAVFVRVAKFRTWIDQELGP